MEYALVYLTLGIVFALYMTWGVGANDVANAMGTSVGSGAITVKKAILIAAVFEFSGAFLAGGHVTGTIRKGIIDATLVPSPEILVYGMLSALLASGLWLMVASYFGWPVSTTHTIVGSLVGFGFVGLGAEAVVWSKVGSIVASWVVSPALGGVLAFMLTLSVRKLILDTDTPFENAKRWGPAYVFLMGVLIALVTLFKGLKHLNLELDAPQSFFFAIVVGIVVALVGRHLLSRIQVDEQAEKEFHYASVEKVFAPLCVFTACSMAFAHGSNDVANGIGPLAAIASIVKTGEVAQKSALPLWILILGGSGIVVGLARGIGALDLRVVARIVTSWIVTLPIGAMLAAFFFFFFKGVFL